METKEAQIKKLEGEMEVHRILRNANIRGGYTVNGFEGPTKKDLAYADRSTDRMTQIRAELAKLKAV